MGFKSFWDPEASQIQSVLCWWTCAGCKNCVRRSQSPRHKQPRSMYTDEQLTTPKTATIWVVSLLNRYLLSFRLHAIFQRCWVKLAIARVNHCAFSQRHKHVQSFIFGFESLQHNLFYQTATHRLLIITYFLYLWTWAIPIDEQESWKNEFVALLQVFLKTQILLIIWAALYGTPIHW